MIIVHATQDTLDRMAKLVVPVCLAITKMSTVLQPALRAHWARTRKKLREVLFATYARLEPTRWAMPQYAPRVPPTVPLQKAHPY